ncbi:hypothetical protein [Methylovulum miyakonense]|uniref:hypothetical protein n=1 Tax=Methylovulum miyakonense TaxID=645578 RepID=UPI00035FA150|nr:hypothetical protein [Methylovulum miyakonense]
MKFTEGVMEDGAVILNNGEPMAVEEVVAMLNLYRKTLKATVEELESWNLSHGDKRTAKVIVKGKSALSYI